MRTPETEGHVSILAARSGFPTVAVSSERVGTSVIPAMEQNTAQRPGRIIADRYRLGARLGSGVDVAAFEAFDEQQQRTVVVKMVHPDLCEVPQVRRDFRSVMSVAAGIQHPNVSAPLDWGSTQLGSREVLYVVSERLGGGSLRDMLDRGRLLSPSQALMVGLDACKGLDAIHRAGLIHGDIRPSTLVFGDDRRLRLVDVGLSQVVRAAGGGTAASDVQRVRYASPEQAKGLPAEPKGDIYSLCLSLLEALSGAVPFLGDSAVATLTNRVDKLMPVSADLGPLATVLERAGRPDADDRFTAAEFGRSLVQTAEKLPRPAPLPIIGGSLFTGDPSGPVDAPSEAIAATPSNDTRSSVLIDTSGPIIAARQSALATDADGLRIVGDPVLADAFNGGSDSLDDQPRARRRGRKWLALLLVVLLGAGGAAAWWVNRPVMRTVPDLVGLEKGVALNEIAGDFSPLEEPQPDDDVAAGLVIGTDPMPGTSLEQGSTLTLLISTGPAPRELPELTGLTLDEATGQLENLGLVLVEGEAVFDEEVEAGVVVSWSVPDSPALVAGGTVTKGSSVQVVVSKGPAPRVVPNLSGKTLAEATKLLADLDLEIVQASPDVFSATVAAGLVAVQDKAAGAELQKGDTVTVTLSKGPDLVAMPSLLNMNYDSRVKALTDAGFTVGPLVGNKNNRFLGGFINGTIAAAGSTWPRGTVVELRYNS